MMAMDPTIGILNYLLSLVHLPEPLWLGSASTVIPSLVLVDTWKWIPFVALIVLAGYSALPAEPYESAVIDGASPLQLFWYLTLPFLRPTIIVATMFRAIDSIKTFDIIIVMTEGGPAYRSETVNIYAFKQIFRNFRFGYGSSILTVVAISVFVLVYVLSKLRRKKW